MAQHFAGCGSESAYDSSHDVPFSIWEHSRTLCSDRDDVLAMGGVAGGAVDPLGRLGREDPPLARVFYSASDPVSGRVRWSAWHSKRLT